jgi:hypothetical protein
MTFAFPKPQRFESEEYKAWIRTQRCIVLRCKQETEPHHIRYAWNSGAGTKPSDTFCLPCCRAHHDEFHALTREPFEAKYGLDLLRLIVEHLTLFMAERE